MILKFKTNNKFDFNNFILYVLTIDENLRIAQNLKKENLSNIICNTIVFLTIVFTTLHFANYAINSDIFGYIDVDRYYQWIRQMRVNLLFGEGVYPFGLMTYVYLVSAVLPIDLKIVLKFTCSVSIVFLLVSFYWFLKLLLKRKETIAVIFLLVLFIVSILVNIEENGKIVVYGLSRFQYTLTNEFALWGIFVAPICLYKIINCKSISTIFWHYKYSLLFILSLTVAICVHPYILFLQFLTCLPVFLIYINKLNLKKFLNLVFDVLVSFVVGVAPLVLNFLKVNKLYGSFEWATGLVTGEKGTAENITSVPTLNSIVNVDDVQINSFFDYLNVFYNEAVKDLFGAVLTPFVILFFIAGIVLAIYLMLKPKDNGKHYLILVLCSVFYFVTYIAPILNLWRLIEGYRIVYVLYLLILSVCLIPLDHIFNKYLMKI